ncbi:MAG: hypothetical protein A2W91_06720 [Bacteroidetes bacterium GWF2_38_335]|nr:MAG: hypothetical protein A2W91_06720 [Bacteroidetes bacterium GWF2_38_335]OFY79855.1 MAG: hypothetical protein A2281_09360 [Bacteroidetes bacterium RIFOXYA12_FULL_38_20]
MSTSFIINAQPVLTPEDITPLPGETFTKYFMNYAWVDPDNSGGENVTWNLSGIEVSSSYEMTCLEVAGSPYESYFAGSDYCMVIDFSTPRYIYYSIENNFLNEDGYGSGNVVQTSSNPISLIHFPVSFLDVFIDTISSTYYTTTGDTFRTDSGIRHCQVDGYGNLELPDVVYENVIRIHCIDTVTIADCGDTINLNGYSFLWLKEDYHQIIFELYDGMGYGAYYNKALSVNFEQDFKTNTLTIYPNPFTEYINIVIPFFFNEAVIEIMDVNGNKVFTEKFKNLKQKTFLGFLPAGFYYARIIVNNEIYEYKLVKI